jgi:hypothetical protein
MTTRELTELRTLDGVQGQHSGFEADFDVVYDQLKAAIANNGQPISAVTLIVLVKRCIKLVERVGKDSGDKGGAKQQLVMALMTRLIEDSSMSEDDQIALQVMLETLGPSIIELAIEGSVIGVNRLKGLFSCCK